MSRFSEYREQVLEAGYAFSKLAVLKAAFELNVFEALGADSKTAYSIAEEVNTDARATGLFLNALAALNFIQKSGNSFSHTVFGKDIFLKTGRQYVGDIVGLQSRSAGDWLNLAASVRMGKQTKPAEFFDSEKKRVKAFISAMNNTGVGHAERLAAKLNLKEVRTLIDIGGGSGVFTIHFLKENPQMKAVIFDLPGTLEVTKEFIRESGMESRVSYQAGNFNTDPIMGRYDAIFLSHILHGLDESKSERLTEKVFSILNPNGQMIVQDFFLNEDRMSPQFSALFALNMLLYTDGGRSYTFQEAEHWMRRAGFSAFRRPQIRLPRAIAILIGKK